MLGWLTGDGKAELKEIGGIFSATAGVLLREVVPARGRRRRRALFGEPAFAVAGTSCALRRT